MPKFFAWIALFFLLSLSACETNTPQQKEEGLLKILKQPLTLTEKKLADSTLSKAERAEIELALSFLKSNPASAKLIRLQESLAPNKVEQYKPYLLILKARLYSDKKNFEKSDSLFSLVRDIVTNDKLGLALYYHPYGHSLYRRGKLEEAEKEFIQAIKYREALGLEGLAGISHLNHGVVLRLQGNIPGAVAAYEKAQHNYLFFYGEESRQIGDIHNNLGSVFYSQKEYEKATEKFRKALHIYQKINYQARVRMAYNNLGSSFMELGKIDSAVHYHTMNYEASRAQGDNWNLSFACQNLSDLYVVKKQPEKARPYLKEGMALLADLQSKDSDAEYLSSEAKLLIAEGKHNEALAKAKAAAALAEEIDYPDVVRDALESQKECYEALNQPQKALETYEAYIELRETMRNQASLKAAMNQEFALKEEKLKLNQVKEKLALEQEISEEKARRNMFLLAALLLAALAFVAFRYYKLKQRDNRLLKTKNTEIEQQKEEIQAQNATLNNQREELMVLNENLSAQKEELQTTYDKLHFTSEQLEKSLTYASDIQQIIIPRPQRLEGFFEDTFAIFLPKDVVSGDFYWFSKLNEKEAVFVLADCTGHGVPGAFMSMLGSALLHETINVKGVHQDPARILRNLNAGLRKILRQQEGRNNDGMDVSVCCFERQESDTTLTFCGAKSKAWLAVPNEALQELKGDRISIGGKKTEKEFENQQYILCPETIVYLSTDGYIDQSNPKRKRLGSRTFKTLLQENREKPFATQKEVLLDALNAHQQDAEQRDDISVVGLCLGKIN